MQWFSLVIILLVALLCIVVAHRMAERKGLNGIFWGVMAGVFGPFVFPVLLVIPSKKSSTDAR